MAGPRGTQIDAISVSLGLNLTQLEKDIGDAKTKLSQLASGRKAEIPVTLDLNHFNAQVSRAQKTLQTGLKNAIRQVNETGLNLNPRFTVSNTAIRQLRRDINGQLREGAQSGQAVVIPVRAAMSKSDANTMLRGIQNSLNASTTTVSIGVDWHWVNGPPPGNGPFGTVDIPVRPTGGGGGGRRPAGGGGGAAPTGGGGAPAGGARPTSGGAPAGGGTQTRQRAQPQAQPQPRPQPQAQPQPQPTADADRIARLQFQAARVGRKGANKGQPIPSAQRAAQTLQDMGVAPIVPQAAPPATAPTTTAVPRPEPVQAAPATGRKPRAPKVSQPTGTAPAAAPVAEEAPAERRPKRGTGGVPLSQVADVFESITPTKGHARPSPNRGIRGAGVAGVNMTDEDRINAARTFSPAEITRRKHAREQYQQHVSTIAAQDQGMLGFLAKRIEPRRQDESLEEFKQRRAQAERVRVSARKARAINQAMTRVQFDANDVPDFSELSQLDPDMGAVWEKFIRGERDAPAFAQAMVERARLGDISVKGEGEQAGAAAVKRRSRSLKKFSRVIGDDADVDRMDQVLLTKAATASAVNSFYGVEKDPTRQNRRATARYSGRKGGNERVTSDRGFLNSNDRQMSDSARKKLLRAKLGIKRRTDPGWELELPGLEAMATAAGLRISLLKDTPQDIQGGAINEQYEETGGAERGDLARKTRAPLTAEEEADLAFRNRTARAGGGPIGGMRQLPLFGRGMLAPFTERQAQQRFGEVGDRFISPRGEQYILRNLPLDQITPRHPVDADRVAQYTDFTSRTGSPIPPLITKGGVISDGHHRFAMARALGLESMLAYTLDETKPHIAPPGGWKAAVKAFAKGGALASYKQIERMVPRNWDRIMRRHAANDAVMKQGFGATSPERALPNKLVGEADALHERLVARSNELFPEAYPEIAKRMGLAGGGFVRPFGGRAPNRIGDIENVARANSYQWKKTRAATIRRQPFCSYCGIGRAEARATGNPLTADHMVAQIAGGDPYDPNNLHTVCRSCNSRKGYLSHSDFTGELYTKPRRWKRPERDPRARAHAEEMQERAGGGMIGDRAMAQGWSSGHLPSLAQDPRAVLVGERGPEVIVPAAAGMVIPNHMLGMLPQRATGGPYPFRGTFHGSRGQVISEATAARQGFVAGTGVIQRVYVVNWPGALNSSAAAAAAAGGPAQARVAQPVVAAGAAPAGGAAAAGAAAANQAAAGAQLGQAVAAGLAQQQRRAGGAGGAGAAPRVPGRTPAQQVQARQAAVGSIEDLSDRLTQVGTNISEALQASPVRALSVSLGQIAQNVLGGRQQILERAGVARGLAGRAQREVTFLQSRRQDVETLALQRRTIQQNLVGLAPAEVSALAKENRAALRLAIKGVRAQEPFAERATATAEEAAGGIVSKGQAFRAQALGVAGIVGGTVLFSTAMAAAQEGLALIGKVASSASDALGGFRATAIQASSDLAAAIRQSGGPAGAAAAGQFARIGLGIPLPALTTQGARLAGAQNLQQQVSDIRANQQLTNEMLANPNQVRGLGNNFANGPLGGLPLIGPIAGMIEQTPSVAESLAGALPTIQPHTAANRQPGQGGPLTGFWTPGGPNPIQGIADNINLLGQALGLAPTQAEQAKEQVREQAAANIALTGFNKNVARVAIGLGQFTQTADPAKLDATAKALSDTGQQGAVLAARLKSLGQYISLPGGASISNAAQANQFLAANAQGAGMMDRGQLLASMQPQIEAQIRDIQRQAQFQRQTEIPANFAENLLRAPTPTNPSQGITTGAADIFSGVPTEATQSVNAYSDAIQSARDAINAAGAAGEQQLRNLGVPQTEIDSVRNLGQAIADLRNRAETEQLSQEQAVYNRQLYVARRTVGDLIGLEGKNVQTVRALTGYAADGTAQYQDQVIAATELGKLNRAQLEDQRQGALAQLAINRREIEFNLAVSRLSTPGSTPAERATRRQEADLIAREQEAQLNRQQRMTTRGFRIEDIGITQQAQDAVAALQQMQAGHAVEVDVRGINKLVEADQMLLDLKTQFLDVSKQAGEQMAQVALQTQAAIEAQTGQFEGDFAKEVDASMKVITDKYADTFKLLLPTLPTTQPPPGGYVGPGGSGQEKTPPADKGNNGSNGGGGSGNGGGSGGAFASGVIGDVTGRTSVTVGEAGREKLIVIRNPRRGQLAGMPGFQTMAAGPISISFGDVHVRDSSDIDAIASRVEQMLNRRAALLGITGRQ